MESEFPILKTEKLLLRKFIQGDLENVYLGLSHPDVIKYYGISYDSLEATKMQLKYFDDLEKTGTGIWWAICSPDNNVFYGAVGLNNMSHIHKRAEIGFWILPDFWRKGIVTEAIPVICNYAFNDLEIHRIEAQVETENANCKKTMKKLNFIHEGTLVDFEIKDGKYISLDIFAKFNPH